jgi:hypothetical protein
VTLPFAVVVGATAAFVLVAIFGLIATSRCSRKKHGPNQAWVTATAPVANISLATPGTETQSHASSQPSALEEHSNKEIKRLQAELEAERARADEANAATDAAEAAARERAATEYEGRLRELEERVAAQPAGDSGGDGSECVICLEASNTHMLYPCAHKCVCESCGNELLRTKQACPLCRKMPEKIVRVFE